MPCNAAAVLMSLPAMQPQYRPAMQLQYRPARMDPHGTHTAGQQNTQSNDGRHVVSGQSENPKAQYIKNLRTVRQKHNMKMAMLKPNGGGQRMPHIKIRRHAENRMETHQNTVSLKYRRTTCRFEAVIIKPGAAPACSQERREHAHTAEDNRAHQPP